MEQLNLKEITLHINGDIIQGNKHAVINKVVTKPEKVIDNTLLFHLHKNKEDTHLYRFNGSNVIVTDKPNSFLQHASDAAIVQVKDVNRAYWDFVRYYRGLFEIPVIGVTGTCGKTTSTEMIKTILSKKYKTRSTWDGNNIWYLALPYLLKLNSKTEAAVFEMGVEKPGDLEYICKHYRPRVGVLMNIGTYHLQGCGTLQNYIDAKAELLEGLEFKGILILNADDKNIEKIDLSPFKGKIVYFGLNDKADFRAKDVKYAGDGMEFILLYQDQPYKVFVPGLGIHNVYNALAALAATHSVGIALHKSVKWLASYKPVRQHMQVKKGINNCTIIDDTWNCTPPSMECGMEVLKKLGKSKKTVAVFGYMPRLGTGGYSEYDRIGKMAAVTGFDYIITLGNDAKKIGLNAIKTGMDRKRVFFCSSASELYQTLVPLTSPETMILFKFPYKYRLSKDPSFVEFMGKIFS